MGNRPGSGVSSAGSGHLSLSGRSGPPSRSSPRDASAQNQATSGWGYALGGGGGSGGGAGQQDWWGSKQQHQQREQLRQLQVGRRPNQYQHQHEHRQGDTPRGDGPRRPSSSSSSGGLHGGARSRLSRSPLVTPINPAANAASLESGSLAFWLGAGGAPAPGFAAGRDDGGAGAGVGAGGRGLGRGEWGERLSFASSSGLRRIDSGSSARSARRKSKGVAGQVSYIPYVLM